MKQLFDPSLPFFKGNLHMHTTRSDGSLSPEEALERYRAKGYHFVALTDHWHANEPKEFAGMVVLSGVELDTRVDETQVAHIVGIGLEPEKLDCERGQLTAQALIDRIHEANGFAILAHPAWSLNTKEFINSLSDVDATEIYNTFSGMPWNPDRADSAHILDLVFTGGKRIPLVASDDSHRYQGEDGVSATMVNAKDATAASLLDALRAGRFYAGQGPAIRQITIEGRSITVEMSPCEHVIMNSNMQRGGKSVISGHDMITAQYVSPPGERYLRVELVDRFGRKAWSSPFELEG